MGSAESLSQDLLDDLRLDDSLIPPKKFELPHRVYVEPMHKAYKVMGKEAGDAWLRDREDAVLIDREVYEVYRRLFGSPAEPKVHLVIPKNDRVRRSAIKALLADTLVTVTGGEKVGEDWHLDVRIADGVEAQSYIVHSRQREIPGHIGPLSPLMSAFAQMVRNGTATIYADFDQVVELEQNGYDVRREGSAVSVSCTR